ncbi:MAG: nucleotide exchange factor GrpE [Bacteroidales bacterium]|nr:nucleotide exchange factor GrpE [Bacteroidales bacterium]
MEQNKENQETEMHDENIEQNAENTQTADTNTEATDNKAEAETENVAENSAQEDFETKYNELNDRYLRLMAEFDNYRKRTLKEKMDLTKYAEEDVLKGILQVVDNMERAIKSMESASDMDAVKEGISLIYKKFQSFLESRGLKEVEAMGQELNTDLHEAVTKFAAPSEELKGKIMDVIEKGYYLHDKVIRYAKVVIGE